MSKSISIDIVSDHVCPWCYVGKRRLEKALAERPDLEVQISWLPFQLSPEMPREGRDRVEYYNSIFGEARAQTIMAGMADTGRDDGIEFQLKPGAKAPNTLAAHTLMLWASQAPEVDQTELAEKLFAAHHVDCEDIGDLDVLARIAESVGMDGAAIAARLRERAGEAEVQSMIEQARAAGVTGVPFFIIDRRLALSGAQPPEILLQAIDQALSEPPAAATSD